MYTHLLYIYICTETLSCLKKSVKHHDIYHGNGEEMLVKQEWERLDTSQRNSQIIRNIMTIKGTVGMFLGT